MKRKIVLSRPLAHFLHLALRLLSVNHLVNVSLVRPSLTETGVQSVSQQCESSTAFSLPNYNQLKAGSADRKYVALRRAALWITVAYQPDKLRLLYFILPPTLFSEAGLSI